MSIKTPAYFKHAAAGILSFLLFFFVTKDLPFFWDSIQLGARQADHIYQTASFLLPNEIDSGHPPGFGAYLALWWSVFGRSLWVSHLAMLPWVWLCLQQVYLLTTENLGKSRGLVALLILCEPVLLGQLLMVSPDLVLIAAYLLGLRQLSKGKQRNNWLLLLAVVILALVSSRGWIAAFSLFLVDWLHMVLLYKFLPTAESQESKEPPPTPFKMTVSVAWQKIPPFLLGGLIGLFYLIYHYKAKAWISYHPESPWAESFQIVDMAGFLKNIGLVGWRMIDLGRLSLWMALGVAVYQHGWKRLINNQVWQHFLLAILFFMLLLLPLALLHTGLTSPRYFLPAIVVFDFFVLYTILNPHLTKAEMNHYLRISTSPAAEAQRWQKYLVYFCLTCLLSGNFWIYPHRIAQAWDATPAHLPFYKQEAAAINFLQTKGVPLEAVGTVFPSVGSRDWRLLNRQQAGFSSYQAEKQSYFFVSIIHNDWSDSQLDSLATYPIVWQQKHWNGVWSVLYKKTKASPPALPE